MEVEGERVGDGNVRGGRMVRGSGEAEAGIDWLQFTSLNW